MKSQNFIEREDGLAPPKCALSGKSNPSIEPTTDAVLLHRRGFIDEANKLFPSEFHKNWIGIVKAIVERRKSLWGIVKSCKSRAASVLILCILRHKKWTGLQSAQLGRI
jgi:hypothetical protein